VNENEIKKALDDILFDSAIVRHGFVAYLRDYDFVIQISKDRLLFRFTHCVSARTTTTLEDSMWRHAWDDAYTSEEAYEEAGRPEGFFWGAGYSLAYPGATLLADSPSAREWSRRLGKEMFEVRIETQAQKVDLIFHDLRVTDLPDADD
jgi:hypothetical protein